MTTTKRQTTRAAEMARRQANQRQYDAECRQRAEEGKEYTARLKERLAAAQAKAKAEHPDMDWSYSLSAGLDDKGRIIWEHFKG